MPQVPVYGGPQVRTTPLQVVQQSTPDVSSGIQAVGQGLANVGRGVAEADAAAQARQLRDIRANADKIDTDVTAGWLQWDAENRRKYQGQNAGQYATAAQDWWKKAAEDYGTDTDPRAKELIGQTLGRKRNQAMAAVLGHVGAEKERFADQSAEAAAQTTIDFSVDTGDTVGGANRVRQLAAETGARKGWTTEQTQAEQQRLLATLHLAMVSKLADGDPTKARAYYEANKHEVPAAARARVEQVLKAETDNQFATQFAARLAGKPLSEQLASAAEIKDPSQREKTLLQVRNNHALVKASEQEREAGASDKAWQMVGQGKRVPEQVLMQMNGRERVQLQDHLKSQARLAAAGTPVKTDWAVYEDLRVRLAAGENIRLAAFGTKLASGEMEKLIDFKTKKDNPKTGPEVASSEQQLSALAGGLNLKAEEKGKFTSAAQDLFNEHLKRTGKEPVFEERQKILDQMVKEVVTKPGWLWDTKGPAYELPRDQLRQKTAPPDKFTPGQFYRDAENNRSKYLGNGKWEPVN